MGTNLGNVLRLVVLCLSLKPSADTGVDPRNHGNALPDRARHAYVTTSACVALYFADTLRGETIYRVEPIGEILADSAVLRTLSALNPEFVHIPKAPRRAPDCLRHRTVLLPVRTHLGSDLMVCTGSDRGSFPNVFLPDGVSALSGAVRLWPFQREIADAIGDPTIERVTLVKPVRVGLWALLTGALAS